MALASFCLNPSSGPIDVELVVENVAIVDVRSGKHIEHHVLVVDDGVILDVVPEASAASYVAERIIDGAGGYLIPALGDVHVHLQSYAELKSYLRYGVTAVFNMSGRPEHLRMKASTSRGDVLGPRIFSVGPTLDGLEPTNPLFTAVTPDTADEIVAWIQAQGYDAIKVYQRIEQDALAAVVSSATARGMITTGHVSRLAGIDGSLAAGLRYIAHGEELAFPYYDSESRGYVPMGLPALARLLRVAGATVTPMVDYLESIPPQVLDLDGYLDQAPMQLVPAAVKLSWGERQGYYSNRRNPVQYVAQVRALAGFVGALTHVLQDEGVPLLLGTDASFGGAIPGYSVHQELLSLVRVGLTPLQALQAATINVGVYLNDSGVLDVAWGEIKAGYAADFVLLRRDPLADISATQDIAGVAKAGAWLGQLELANIESALRVEQDELYDKTHAVEAHIAEGDAAALRALVDAYRAPGVVDPLIHPDNCIFLGYRHYYGGRRALAGELYESCALMSPRHAPLWIHVARAREASGDEAGALEAYQTAESLNPWYGRPRQAVNRLERE
ncbi:MAG: amidohydrolase family protein [Pseudomonadota bacterium]